MAFCSLGPHNRTLLCSTSPVWIEIFYQCMPELQNQSLGSLTPCFSPVPSQQCAGSRTQEVRTHCIGDVGEQHERQHKEHKHMTPVT